MGVNLRGSHLFRASNRHGQIIQNAFQGSAVGNKLKRHLAALQLSDGKTMHGSRSGCSITLSLIGASDDDVAQHVGWKSLTTAQYYTQTRQVIHTSKTATLLSDDATLATSILPSPASRVGSHFRNRNIWTISRWHILVYMYLLTYNISLMLRVHIVRGFIKYIIMFEYWGDWVTWRKSLNKAIRLWVWNGFLFPFLTPNLAIAWRRKELWEYNIIPTGSSGCAVNLQNDDNRANPFILQ